MLWTCCGVHDRAEMFAFGRNDLQTAGSGDITIAGGIDLDAVDGVFAFERREVKEQLAVRDRPSGAEFVAPNDFAVVVPIADIQIFLVGRKGDAVRAGKLCWSAILVCLYIEHTRP